MFQGKKKKPAEQTAQTPLQIRLDQLDREHLFQRVEQNIGRRLTAEERVEIENKTLDALAASAPADDRLLTQEEAVKQLDAVDRFHFLLADIFLSWLSISAKPGMTSRSLPVFGLILIGVIIWAYYFIGGPRG